MSETNEKKSLPFFGVGKVLPFMKPYRKIVFTMIFCGLLSSGVDILLPQYQRYALNHFIAKETLSTLPVFLGSPVEVCLYLFLMDCCIIKLNYKHVLDKDLQPLLHIFRPSPMLQIKGIIQ